MFKFVMASALVVAAAAFSAGSASAEKMGSTTHVLKDGRPKVGFLRPGALDGLTKESVAKYKLCTQGGGMFKSGGRWINGRCVYPDGTSWKG